MTAYEIIQQHPEWVKNPRATRKEIQAQAARYVRELDSKAALMVEDIDALLIARNAILSPTDQAKDFADIAIVGNEIVEDGAKRQAQVYAIFIKAIIAALNGKAICTAAQVEQWRERYGIKLDGLQGKPEKAVTFEPIGLDNDSVMCLYNWLMDNGKINCTEQDFIWYFGKPQSRESDAEPKPIKWLGQQINEYVYFCHVCAIKTGNARVKWGTYNRIFTSDRITKKNCRPTLSRILNGTDAYPSNALEIESLFR